MEKVDLSDSDTVALACASLVGQFADFPNGTNGRASILNVMFFLCLVGASSEVT